MLTDEQRQIVARALPYLLHKATWTRGAYARDARGVDVDAEGYTAAQFCAYGALQKAAYEHKGYAGTRECPHIATELCGGRYNMTMTNDVWVIGRWLVIWMFRRGLAA